MEGVSVRDIMGPTNVAYYIDEISWEMSLLVPLINTQRIVITLLFSFCAPSLFFFLSKPCSVLLFRVHQDTHTQKCHLRHTKHNGKLQAFMQRVKDVYEKKYQQIMINNCSFYLNLWNFCDSSHWMKPHEQEGQKGTYLFKAIYFVCNVTYNYAHRLREHQMLNVDPSTFLRFSNTFFSVFHIAWRS